MCPTVYAIAAPYADGRKQHDDVGELEHRLRETFREEQHRPALRVTQKAQRDCEQDAEHHHLQHLALVHRPGDVLRKNVQEDVGHRLLGRRRERLRWRRQLHPHACLAEVDRGQADEKRDRGDHLEIDQRLDAHSPDFLQVGVPGDPHNQRPEQQRRDDRLDQPQEDHAQHAQVDREGREVVADLCSNHHAYQNEGGQRALGERPADEAGNGQPARGGEQGGGDLQQAVALAHLEHRGSGHAEPQHQERAALKRR